MEAIHTLWTIGHSNQSLEQFIELLKEYEIEVLADIRHLPGSRKYPWFNQENLAVELPRNKIEYLYIKELGGYRKRNPDSQNTVWKNLSFRSYADYMETFDFIIGVGKLMNIASEKRTAIMCSEAVWWRCHRSMVSDYMKSIGWEVIHIMSLKNAKIHPYTAPAKIIDGKLHYGKA